MAPRFLHVIAAVGVACAASLCCAAGAFAADVPRTFAVMSLIGDSLSVVRHAPSIGSSFDRNVAEPMVLRHDHFDRPTLTAAGDAIGRGRLGGLGYHLDHETAMHDLTTNATTVGFVAPLAYLIVSLVDLSADRIVRSGSATLSSIAEGRSNDVGGPWERTSPADKDGLIRRATDDIVPRLLAVG